MKLFLPQKSHSLFTPLPKNLKDAQMSHLRNHLSRRFLNGGRDTKNGPYLGLKTPFPLVLLCCDSLRSNSVICLCSRLLVRGHEWCGGPERLALFVVNARFAFLGLSLGRSEGASEHVVCLYALLVALVPRNGALELESLVFLALLVPVEQARSLFEWLLSSRLLLSQLGRRVEEGVLRIRQRLLLSHFVGLGWRAAPKLKFSILWNCL